MKQLIRKNEAIVNGITHSITWSGAATRGQRTSALIATCSCGWKSDVGSEASGRRDFTSHVNAQSAMLGASQAKTSDPFAGIEDSYELDGNRPAVG